MRIRNKHRILTFWDDFLRTEEILKFYSHDQKYFHINNTATWRALRLGSLCQFKLCQIGHNRDYWVVQCTDNNTNTD